jgi:hypothetical protein
MTDRVSSREQPRDEGMKGLARSSGYHTVLLAIRILVRINWSGRIFFPAAKNLLRIFLDIQVSDLPPMAPPSKRSAHSDVDKQSLRVYARQNPSYKQHELLDWAKSHLNCSSTITQSMVSKWLGPRYEYLDSPTASTARMDGGKMFRPNRKKRRTEAFPIIELALYEWHCRAEKGLHSAAMDSLSGQRSSG